VRYQSPCEYDREEMVAEVEAVVDILKVDSLEFGVDGEADDEEECTHERVRRVFETSVLYVFSLDASFSFLSLSDKCW
jgi:hypothetical protein